MLLVGGCWYGGAEGGLTRSGVSFGHLRPVTTKVVVSPPGQIDAEVTIWLSGLVAAGCVFIDGLIIAHLYIQPLLKQSCGETHISEPRSRFSEAHH